jgi:hypothetical protein
MQHPTRRRREQTPSGIEHRTRTNNRAEATVAMVSEMHCNVTTFASHAHAKAVGAQHNAARSKISDAHPWLSCDERRESFLRTVKSLLGWSNVDVPQRFSLNAHPRITLRINGFHA